MKRDMDLIRKILRKIRDHEDPYGLDGIPEIEGYSKKEISYNIGILKDADLLTARPSVEMRAKYENYFGINLTWEGHDFIDAAAKKWGQISILDICQYIFWPERHQSTF
jgi:hypothetical protein